MLKKSEELINARKDTSFQVLDVVKHASEVLMTEYASMRRKDEAGGTPKKEKRKEKKMRLVALRRESMLKKSEELIRLGKA